MKTGKMEMKLDRISNLPEVVTEEILRRLPLKDAARTSILSSKWRYNSGILSALVFDETCLSTPTSSLANIVDHILLHHTGLLLKFKLSHNDELAHRDIDRWIFHLSRVHEIREMVLDIWKGNPYNIPSCLFSCQDIVYLELYRCLLKPSSSTCQGFRSLKTLKIDLVTMAQDVFENLIDRSPLLEVLHIADCEGVTNLKINAANLWHLDAEGAFEDVKLDKTSNLTHVGIHLQANVHQRRRPGDSDNLVKFFDHHPRIERFTMNNNFLKYLSTGALPEKLPKPCEYLTCLSVNISSDNPDEISTLLCLLRSYPLLQELEIWVEEYSEKVHAAVGEVESSLYDNYNWTCTQLRVVEIAKMSCVKAQLDLIKFLLLNSPVLERMTVQPASADVVSKLVKDLLQFKRDSKHAEIILLDP